MTPVEMTIKALNSINEDYKTLTSDELLVKDLEDEYIISETDKESVARHKAIGYLYKLIKVDNKIFYDFSTRFWYVGSKSELDSEKKEVITCLADNSGCKVKFISASCFVVFANKVYNDKLYHIKKKR